MYMRGPSRDAILNFLEFALGTLILPRKASPPSITFSKHEVLNLQDTHRISLPYRILSLTARSIPDHQNDHSDSLLLVRKSASLISTHVSSTDHGPQVIADLYEKYIELIGQQINDEGDTISDG